MTGLDTCRALELRCRKSPIELMLFEPLPSGVALGTSAMGWRHHTKGRIGRPLERLLISCKSSACWYLSDRWLAQCIAFASELKCVGPVRPDCKEHLEQQFIGNTPIVAISSSPILASNLSEFAGPECEHRSNFDQSNFYGKLFKLHFTPWVPPLIYHQPIVMEEIMTQAFPFTNSECVLQNIRSDIASNDCCGLPRRAPMIPTMS